MILTDKDFNLLRQSLEEQHGLDQELFQECNELLRSAAYDDAARRAFVILESRLRNIADVGDRKLTAVPLVKEVFDESGPLGNQLGQRREAFQEIYSGAFKLFRNPMAHGTMKLDGAKGRSIIELVNLLLVLLNELRPPIVLPENVELILEEFRKDKFYGPTISDNLNNFVKKCIQLGLAPQKGSQQIIPFRRRARIKQPHWAEPKVTLFPVFHLDLTGEEKSLRFLVYQYHNNVIGLDADDLKKRITNLGGYLSVKGKEYVVSLHPPKDASFFKQLYDLVRYLSQEIDKSLRA